MPHAPQAWQRLAESLTQRRGTIESNGKRFARRTGLNYRLIWDLENAKRTTYRPATIAAVEAAYRWAPGSIESVLQGGEPTPLNEADQSARTETDELTEEELADVNVQHILSLTRIPWDERVEHARLAYRLKQNKEVAERELRRRTG